MLFLLLFLVFLLLGEVVFFLVVAGFFFWADLKKLPWGLSFSFFFCCSLKLTGGFFFSSAAKTAGTHTDPKISAAAKATEQRIFLFIATPDPYFPVDPVSGAGTAVFSFHGGAAGADPCGGGTAAV